MDNTVEPRFLCTTLPRGSTGYTNLRVTAHKEVDGTHVEHGSLSKRFCIDEDSIVNSETGDTMPYPEVWGTLYLDVSLRAKRGQVSSTITCTADLDDYRLPHVYGESNHELCLGTATYAMRRLAEEGAPLSQVIDVAEEMLGRYNPDSPYFEMENHPSGYAIGKESSGDEEEEDGD